MLLMHTDARISEGVVADDETRVGLKVARQLVSRLCHDLVGPMGAVNNGLELLADAPEESDDALDLVDQSARMLMARFTFLRAALGMGGVRDPAGPAELAKIAALAVTGNVVLEWRDDAVGLIGIDPEAGKLVLNMVLMGVESLPRGGTVVVDWAPEADGVKVEVAASGNDARIRPDMLDVFAPEVDEDAVTARNVNAYLACKIAQSIGAGLRLSGEGNGAVRITASLRLS